jgi:hypothetical protein
VGWIESSLILTQRLPFVIPDGYARALPQQGPVIVLKILPEGVCPALFRTVGVNGAAFLERVEKTAQIFTVDLALLQGQFSVRGPDV